jgi:hypothetical protein
VDRIDTTAELARLRRLLTSEMQADETQPGALEVNNSQEYIPNGLLPSNSVLAASNSVRAASTDFDWDLVFPPTQRSPPRAPSVDTNYSNTTRSNSNRSRRSETIQTWSARSDSGETEGQFIITITAELTLHQYPILQYNQHSQTTVTIPTHST